MNSLVPRQIQTQNERSDKAGDRQQQCSCIPRLAGPFSSATLRILLRCGRPILPVSAFVVYDSPCPRPAPATQARGPDSPHGFRANALQSVATSLWQLDTRWSSGFLAVLMSRPCSTRLLNLNYVYLATFLSALRTPQSLLQIRELRIQSANVRQQIRIHPTFMSAPGAFDYQQILPELVG